MELPSACQKVARAFEQSGTAILIVQHEQSARTAQEAADACGCDLAQIVKSLIFTRVDTDQIVLLLVSGANRVHETRTGRQIGAKLKRAEIERVRRETGFAIGGIPPFGHLTKLETYIDEDLLEHKDVWAAAGTPNSVFNIDPKNLADLSEAKIICVK